jgi:sarcosine oxidase
MATPKTYDAIVLGLGGMGSAALYHLAKRGHTVAGIEQHHVAHDRGSSHGNLRIIRKAYHEHPNYVPLLDRAYVLWRDLEQASERTLFAQTGLILAGLPQSESMQGLAASYAANDLPHEMLQPAEVMNRYPQFRIPEDYTSYFDPLGGYLFVEQCVETHLDLAERLGAEVHIHEPASAWRADETGVTVTTAKGELHGAKLVIAVGPWSGAVMNEIGVRVEVVRKVQLWYGAPGLERYTPPHFVPFFFEHDYGVFYGFPSVDYAGLKVAEHSGGEPVADPQAVDRSLKAEDEAPVRRFLADSLPGFEPELRRHSICMYTKTPDQHFVVDVHPRHDNVVVAAGFSGHGFKFASVIGEILADLAIDGHTDLPADFLSLERLKAPH